MRPTADQAEFHVDRKKQDAIVLQCLIRTCIRDAAQLKGRLKRMANSLS